MNLKVSLFNKSIFKTDIKRFWIASLLYTVLLFFLVPFQYVAGHDRFFDATAVMPVDYHMTSFAANTYPALFLGMLCGGVFALMIFMYINSTPAISFYHSLPHRRTTIYFTKLLSGSLLLVVPILINLVILLSAKASGTYIPAYYSHILIWSYLQLAYTLIVFFGVSFVAMFTGNFMYLIAVSGICVITPLLTITFVEGLLSEHLYGYVGAIEDALYWVYLIPKYMLSPRGFIYLALAIVFIILGCVIYNKRDLEKNGEAIVFNRAKVFFLYLVAFLCGILSYWYFSSLLGYSVLWMLPFGLAGIIAANMINKKQVTLKGFVKPALIYTVAVVIIFLGFKFDITGFEKRLPEADDVKEVYVSVPMIENTYSVRGATYGYREAYEKEKAEISITDKEEIEKVIGLHSHKIANRGKRATSEFNTTIKYKLKNGRTLERGYIVYRDDNFAADVFMFENMKAKRYHPYKDESVKYQHITISHDFVKDPIVSYLAGSEDFEALKKALHEDIKNLDYRSDATVSINHFGSSDMRLEIAIEPDLSAYKNEAKATPYAATYPSDKNPEKPSVVYSYIITDGFTKTKAFLEEKGFYEKIPKAEEITSMHLRYYGDTFSEALVTDKADIEKIYEIVMNYDRINMPYSEKQINIEIDTESNSFEISFPKSVLASVTDKYIK